MNTILAAVLVLSSTAWASWASTTLEEDVCRAEAIVIGKLSNIKSRYMSVAFENMPQLHKSYYDQGYIAGARVLKADGDIERFGDSVSVIFDSPDQEGHPLSHMKIPQHDGEEGIWFLRHDYYSGSYTILKPKNPLPMTEEAEVAMLVKKAKCQARPN